MPERLMRMSGTLVLYRYRVRISVSAPLPNRWALDKPCRFHCLGIAGSCPERHPWFASLMVEQVFCNHLVGVRFPGEPPWRRWSLLLRKRLDQTLAWSLNCLNNSPRSHLSGAGFFYRGSYGLQGYMEAVAKLHGWSQHL